MQDIRNRYTWIITHITANIIRVKIEEKQVKYFYTILFYIRKSLFVGTLSANSKLLTGEMHKREGQRNAPGGWEEKSTGKLWENTKGGTEKCSKVLWHYKQN